MAARSAGPRFLASNGTMHQATRLGRANTFGSWATSGPVPGNGTQAATRRIGTVRLMVGSLAVILGCSSFRLRGERVQGGDHLIRPCPVDLVTDAVETDVLLPPQSLTSQ